MSAPDPAPMSVREADTPVQDYWVELRHGVRGLGAAFFLTRRFLVTAAHCLRPVADDAELTVAFPDGATAPARVHERLRDADLAVVMLIGKSTVQPPQADTCGPRDSWRTPTRPTPSDPLLHGSVVEPDVPFDCAGGARLRALQLETGVELGDYSGYSGGPVERTDSDRPSLVGLLIEQYPDRQRPERASNVLFAATIAEVLNRFDCFDMSNVVGHLHGRAPARATTYGEVLADVTTLLEQVAIWEEHGLMSPAEIASLRLRVQRSVVEEATRRGRP
ncbi:hypothetical protein ACQPZF_18990 [Actinosynnema sp. CS-041913]|uniref:hypothetical protein n=1 Tax=Actinosynnema sp. CS-041913 TaxID=3239917 RepID=UPI003D94AE37